MSDHTEAIERADRGAHSHTANARDAAVVGDHGGARFNIRAAIGHLNDMMRHVVIAQAFEKAAEGNERAHVPASEQATDAGLDRLVRDVVAAGGES